MMPFVGGAVLWGAYTLAYWGWLAMTDRVNPGEPDTFWWPSLLDLVRPGSIGKAVPAKLLKSTAGKASPNAAYNPGGVAGAQANPGQSLPMGPGVQTPSVGTSTNPVRGA